MRCLSLSRLDWFSGMRQCGPADQKTEQAARGQKNMEKCFKYFHGVQSCWLFNESTVYYDRPIALNGDQTAPLQGENEILKLFHLH